MEEEKSAGKMRPSAAVPPPARPILLICLLCPCLLVIASGQSPDAAVDNPRCTEPRDKGAPCPRDGTAPAKKFYYNGQLGVCQPFIFAGCDGNSNRFDSADECRQACASSSSGRKDSWVLADRCNAKHLIPDGHYLECGRQEGGECPQGHDCRAGVCCPQRELVCSLRDDSGTFAEGVPDKPRFAWSAEVHSCWRFSYYGAKGNYNNFPSFQDCVAFCGGANGSQQNATGGGEGNGK